MNEKILFVDDDSNLLASYQRQLRNQFTVDTSADGKQGLETIARQGPYAIIVSDFRMPGMDGVHFLSRAREIAPDSVRMLLTAFADVQTSMEAVNEGNIFRLLTKPCPPDILNKALAAGIKQYQLVTAERELLEKTLNGSIKVLGEVLSLVNPEAFGRASRITRYVRQIVWKMGQLEEWQIETAAMLSQIGWILLPEETLKKIYGGLKLTGEEERIFQMHPSIASGLIGKIPRMENIAEIISYQEKHFDGSGIPADSRRGDQIPLGARILKVVLDFDALEFAGSSKAKALDHLKQRSGWYDPKVLNALEMLIGIEAKYQVRSVMVRDLEENMILAEDVKTVMGLLLISKGQEVSRPLLERLKNFVITPGVQEPIRVIVALKNLDAPIK
jgi:response regulator RpfG family c-di-GMP phosphodiesterase